MPRELEVIEERAGGSAGWDESAVDEERVARLVALGRALSDPIRVRMLGMMVEDRSCCGLPDLGAPADEGEENLGICVCEFEDYFGMGQSKVSYP